MKSFATRSQRDRAFDRLVQNSNHSTTLLQRKVPICKSSPNKSPPVLQRPASPRKCVIVTSFTGDDDGDVKDDSKSSRPNMPGRLYLPNAGSVQKASGCELDSQTSSLSSSYSVTSSFADDNRYSVATNSRDDGESSDTPPLRVTFRLQKCPSSTCTTVSESNKNTITTSSASMTKSEKSSYCIKSKTSNDPLTLSLRRKPDVRSDSKTKWEVALASVPEKATSTGKLSSPPLIQSSKVYAGRDSLSPNQGTKRKTAIENNECEQLEAFVSGLEERTLPKRRMLQPSSATVSSTSSSSSSCTDTNSSTQALSKSRSLLTQKILMSKSISAPTESSTSNDTDQPQPKKKQSLLKKSNSLAVNRKAVYNPRQWIGGDMEDEPHTTDETKSSKAGTSQKSKSAFDFDSDDGESSKPNESPPPRLPARPIIPPVPSAVRQPQQPSSSKLASSSMSSSHPPVAKQVRSEKPNHSSNVRSSRNIRTEQDPKALYTVVRNVKEAHECQESGETQDLLDDVEYMLDGLKSTESPATRCLSLLRLCKECLVHSFRMTLKAHGLLPRIFANVVDAPNDGDCGVALHTAALLFILSRDKLAAGDLDKEGLRLLLRLLHCDGRGLSILQSRELDRIRARLRPVIEQVTKSSATKGSSNSVAQRLHVTCFTAKDLAVESLLNLSVRKASDWFKNELRKEGGLDHFCRATIDAMDYFNNELESQDLTEFMLERLRRIEQYMRLLENMTYMNGDNQEYLVMFEQRSFLDSIGACLRLCVNNLPRICQPDSPSVKVIVACLLSIWRVLLNISHDNEKCSDRLGAHPLLIPLSLHCILRVPQRLPVHRRFDILVLTLGFLVNIVEHCDDNRGRLAYTQVRLPWRRSKTKKNRKRRGLVLNPATKCDDSSSESSDDYEGSDSSSSDDEGAKPKTALDALVNLFLERYQASERLEQNPEENGEEGAEPGAGDDKKEEEGGKANEDEDDGMKWRLIEDKQLERQRRGRHRPFRLLGSGRKDGKDGDSDEEMADDSDSDSGADIEFMPSTQEQSAALESALSRAGEHMEASMTASYVALLLGCMMRGSRRRVDRVQGRLPEGKFKPLGLSLAKFLGFMSLTSAVGQAGGKSMLEVVHFLHELDGDILDEEGTLQSKTKQSNAGDTEISSVQPSSSVADSHSS